jgi:transposase
MDSHTSSPTVSRIEVIETGARRRYTTAEKLRIVAESMVGPRLVSAVARRHNITRGLLATWRKAVREGRLGEELPVVEFAPALICEALPKPSPPATAAQAPTPAGRMEIALSSGVRVTLDASVDIAALERVLAVLERR